VSVHVEWRGFVDSVVFDQLVLLLLGVQCLWYQPRLSPVVLLFILFWPEVVNVQIPEGPAKKVSLFLLDTVIVFVPGG